jgi:hypothetical protein
LYPLLTGIHRGSQPTPVTPSLAKRPPCNIDRGVYDWYEILGQSTHYVILLDEIVNA